MPMSKKLYLCSRVHSAQLDIETDDPNRGVFSPESSRHACSAMSKANFLPAMASRVGYCRLDVNEWSEDGASIGMIFHSGRRVEEASSSFRYYRTLK